MSWNLEMCWTSSYKFVLMGPDLAMVNSYIVFLWAVDEFVKSSGYMI